MAETPRGPVYEVSMVEPDTGVRCYLVIDSLGAGVAAGGVRMTPGVDLGEVRRLARAMTHKFAAVRVPAGGAKAGIAADPRSPDKQKILAGFARLIEPFLRTIYVPGEDMGTSSSDIATIASTLGSSWIKLAKAVAARHAITLQIPDDFDPTQASGTNLELILTGHGIAEVTEEACSMLGIEPAGARVAIQGFGTVGSMAASFLGTKGFKVVAVADIEGTLYRPDGLPIDALMAACDDGGHIDRRKLDFAHQALPRDAWLAVDADVLLPAAIPDAIAEENQSQIRARLVVPGANIAVTEGAERALHARRVAVVPDFIANAGAAGGLGMLLTGQVPLDPGEILAETARRLRRSTRAVLSASLGRDVTPRSVALRIADAGGAAAIAAPSPAS